MGIQPCRHGRHVGLDVLALREGVVQGVQPLGVLVQQTTVLLIN